jgi:hypothetical protein
MTQPKGKMMRSDADYLIFNPFDEGKGDCSIECRKVLIVTIRKPQTCMASYLLLDDSNKGHAIEVGSRTYKESAKVEGWFATCYSCLPCLDVLMDQTYD